MDCNAVKYVELEEFPHYLIGSDGTVWSRWERGRWGRVLPDYRQMKTSLDNHGYKQIGIKRRDGRKFQTKVHRLVCLAFHGPKPDGLVCRHKDGNQLNNSAANLVYGTYAENAADTVSHKRTIRGERAPASKLTWKAVAEIREQHKAGVKQNVLAAKYGVNKATMNAVVNYKAWVPFTNEGDIGVNDKHGNDSEATGGTVPGPRDQVEAANGQGRQGAGGGLH